MLTLRLRFVSLLLVLHVVTQDVSHLNVKIHVRVYTEKELGIAATNTVGKLAARVQRDVVVDLLSQVGRNFSNIGAFIREKVRLRAWRCASLCHGRRF